MPQLPSPLSLLLKSFQVVFDGIAALDLKQQIQTLWEFTDNALQGIDALAAVQLWVMQQERGAVNYAYDKIASGVEGFAEIAANDEIMWSHLIDTLLPNSLGYAVGYVFSNGIIPLRHDVAALWDKVNWLNTRRAEDEAWLYNYVVPAVRGWLEFVKWWDQNFSVPAATLIDWLRHPDHFARWGTPPLLTEMIRYMSYSGHRIDRDNLAQIMLAAWREQPRRTLEEIEAWLLQPIS